MLSLNKTEGWQYGNKASLVLTCPAGHCTAINCPQDYTDLSVVSMPRTADSTCDCWTLLLLSSLALIKSMNDPVLVCHSEHYIKIESRIDRVKTSILIAGPLLAWIFPAGRLKPSGQKLSFPRYIN